MFRTEHALGLAWLTITKIVDGFFLNLPNLIIALMIVLVFFAASNIVKNIINKLASKTHLDITLMRALAVLSSIFISLLGLLTAASVVIPHFSMASVIGGLGISSVAIGFAFKDILQNFFAGMLLLWQKPFTIGDEIKTQSYEGTVEDIRIRSTLLRTHDGELVMIPNGDIYTNPVIVSTAFGKRKVHLTVKVKEFKSLEDTRREIIKTLNTTEGVFKDPAPQAYVADPNADPLTYDVYFWTAARQSEILATMDKVSTRIHDELNRRPDQPAVSSPAYGASPVITNR